MLQERLIPEMWSPRRWESGISLHSALSRGGFTLHLSGAGMLLIEPNNATLDPYRDAVKQHLNYLLVAAAIAEVTRLMATGQRQQQPVNTDMMARLYSVCPDTSLGEARAAAVAYVAGWKQALAAASGEPHE